LINRLNERVIDTCCNQEWTIDRAMIDNALNLIILYLIPYIFNLQFQFVYKKKKISNSIFNETEKILFAVVQTQLRK